MLQSTTRMAKAIMEECVHAFSTLVKEFNFSIVESTHRMAFTKVIASNSRTYIEVTWDPRDHLSYWIGSCPKSGSSPGGYEIAMIANVRTAGVVPMIRGSSGPTKDALENAVQYLITNAPDLLCGDWSRRSEIDESLRRH